MHRQLRRDIGLLCALTTLATTTTVFGPTGMAQADPVCQANGAYELFARGSGESFDAPQAQKFNSLVTAALNRRGIAAVEWAELGNLDRVANQFNNADNPGEYPAVAVDNVRDPAVINGKYNSSVTTGKNELVTHLNDRYAGDGPRGTGSCSTETLVLGGYSQGADVIGWALNSGELNPAVISHIGFVALYGDPKFNPGPLLDRVLHINFQNDWWWVRGNAAGFFVAPPSPATGVLGGRDPYVPNQLKGRFGSWCADFDAMCANWFPIGVDVHANAYQDRWIPDSADEIAYEAKLKRDQLSAGNTLGSAIPYTTVQPIAAIAQPYPSSTPSVPSYPTTDNTRLALPSGAQYIWERGVTLPVDYPDAVRYNNEGNSAVQLNWNGPMNSISLPPNTVVRPVGGNQQYLWSSGGQLLPIGDPATAACYLFSFPQSNPSGQPAIVPADWASGLPHGAQGQCSLGDEIRFTQSDAGPQQYISIRGAALPVNYGDAQALDAEGDPYRPLTLPAGYVSNPIHAAVPPNTVLRAAGNNQQYFWDGNVLHAIPDPEASECQLIAFPQNGVAVVPPSWIAGKPTDNAGQCSLADETRFTESSYSGVQQYVSVRGAAIPLGYSEAQWYDQNGNTAVLDMVNGYVENPIHAAVLPVHTMVEPTGSNAQYLWDGSQLHYVPDPPTSACLLGKYPQNGVARVPAGWLSTLTVGSDVACS